MSRRVLRGNRWHGTTAIGIVLGASMFCGLAAADDQAETKTPIKHLIILIGENRSFDNIYATYQPNDGQSVANLLSRGIILSSGLLGPNGVRSLQYQISTPPTS